MRYDDSESSLKARGKLMLAGAALAIPSGPATVVLTFFAFIYPEMAVFAVAGFAFAALFVAGFILMLFALGVFAKQVDQFQDYAIGETLGDGWVAETPGKGNRHG